ncbi:MAG: 2,3-bisphosphoglycerate-dependent phosphoglycerate mutase [Chlamydiae bacterium]|nr:2,3-bisphosphoglycerate-dependent phosphoglycerate mutase [Chlamydiota bacterium]
MKPVKLILMRHGESIWNKLNLFTGWVDVPLSAQGVQEAIQGGEKIKDIPIDVVFVSSLVRAQTTAVLAMLNHSSKKVLVFQPHDKKMQEWGVIYSSHTKEGTIPVYSSWHLNERMYGELQGLNKDETRKKFGEEQVHIWRRSYDVAPPNGESLKDTAQRTIPYFKEKIMPLILAGKNIFISAHGNSLRSIVMHLDNLSPQEVVKLEIPTGEPIIYEFDKNLWKKI